MKVKSCYKMESGLRLGQEGIHACQLGPFSSPIYFTAEEAANLNITKEMIIEKRKWIFDLLNDPVAETPCKHCDMVIEKDESEVRFDQLGHLDIAATTTCNLRCDFCGYTHFDSFAEAKYYELKILKLFNKGDVVWKAAVDFNGGEPTILKDFDEHIEYFHDRKIRVFLFTNGLVYKQSVFNAIENGTIRWCIVSLDAGTSETYDRTKKSTKYINVIENIAKYSVAGRGVGGQVAVKYIFTENNITDDDVYGFVYTMIATKPQEIWLTFDFDPLCDIPADAENFGGYDYSKHIEAYVKMYLLFMKHGVVPIHYAEKHLAPASLHGKELLRIVKERINLIDFEREANLDLSYDKRSEISQSIDEYEHIYFLKEGEIYTRDNNKIELVGDFCLAPATHNIDRYIKELPNSIEIKKIYDKDLILNGKKIEGVDVEPYGKSLSNFDQVLIKAPEEIMPAIINSIISYNKSIKIVIDGSLNSTKLKKVKNHKIVPIKML